MTLNWTETKPYCFRFDWQLQYVS